MFLLQPATVAFAYGTITGKLQPELPPLRCAAFIYSAKSPSLSPYAAPLFAAACSPDGSFSITVPAGTYIIGSGISIDGKIFAAQRDPGLRLQVEGPDVQAIPLQDKSTYRLTRTNNKIPRPPNPVKPEAPQQKSGRTVTVTGTVRDEGGQPVSLAVVRLINLSDGPNGSRHGAYLSAPTDSKGNFAIEGVAPNTYLLAGEKLDPSGGIMSNVTPPINLTLPIDHHYTLTLFAPTPDAESVKHPNLKTPGQGK